MKLAKDTSKICPPKKRVKVINIISVLRKIDCKYTVKWNLWLILKNPVNILELESNKYFKTTNIITK